MRYLARGLNSVFLPVIIYQTTNSIMLAMLYFIMTSFIFLLFNFCFKKNLVHNVYVSITFSALVFIVLQIVLILQHMSFLAYVFILAILTGIDNVLTLSTLDYLYNANVGSENPKQVRNTFFVEIIANAVAPILGGIILSYVGLAANIVCAIVLTIISVIYLLSHKKILLLQQQHADIKVVTQNNTITTCSQEKTFKPIPLAFAVYLLVMIGVFLRMGLSWNVYLFIIHVQYTTIGILSGLVALGQLVFALLTYTLQTKQQPVILVVFATTVICICMIARLYVTHIYFIYATTICISLSYPMMYQPFKQAYVASVKQHAEAGSIYYMDEFFRQFGCFLLSIVGFTMFALDVLGLQIMFIIGSVAVFISGVIYAMLVKKIK